MRLKDKFSRYREGRIPVDDEGYTEPLPIKIAARILDSVIQEDKESLTSENRTAYVDNTAHTGRKR